MATQVCLRSVGDYTPVWKQLRNGVTHYCEFQILGDKAEGPASDILWVGRRSANCSYGNRRAWLLPFEKHTSLD
jgi:hypothetical protein